MAFPASPLSVKVELQNVVTAGVWTDITSYVYDRDDSAINIVRGRQDEGGGTQPATCNLTLNNRDGRFSPRNPTGPYYGKIGRNTPIRISALIGSPRLLSTASSWMQAPDTAGLSIVGDIDVRVDLRLTDWTVSGRFASKWTTAGNQRSWAFDSTTDGKPVLYWSTNGTLEFSATATVALPQTTGRQTVRATLDVDNGAAGRTVTFYTGTSVDGPWTQLGEPVVQAGVTSIFDSTAVLIGPSTVGAAEVYALKLLQGIGGTERANPNYTLQAEGATSVTDAAGNTWVQAGAPSITARRYRFYGEVSAWPQAWDVSGKDVWVPAAASGVLRRLGQGAAALKGPIYRATVGDANVRAYWPMEDDEGSLSMGSGLSGGPAMTIGGAPDLASSTVFAASEALPVLAGGSFSGPVNAYTSTGTIHARVLMAVPAAGDTNGATIMRIHTTGTAQRWDYVYTTGGGLTLNAYDSFGTSILSQSVGFTNNGKLVALILELVQNGANIDYKMLTLSTIDGGGLQFTGSVLGRTVGAATYVQLNPEGALAGTVVGHLAVASAIPASVEQPLRGYAGETAGRRVERLCSEEGFTFTAYGDLDQSERMGAQKPARLLDLLAECEVADMGQLVESRENLGIGYRTRDSRQYQTAALALEYDNLAELVPVEDDQTTRNDVTVSRVNGSSARITVDSGPLSTQAPPNGVGLYDESLDLSLYTDSQTGHHAQWRATEGTIDEARYPDITVQLEAPSFSASSTLTDQALSVEHGDLITVSSPPAWLPPDTIEQHTIGQAETLGQFEYSISFVCSPATPAGSTTVYDHTDARYSPGTSTLTSGITSTATGAAAISITTAAGSPLWTTSASDFPMNIRIGGEVITLSAISGASSPQSATVSARSVNGVVKAHSAGAAIDIDDPDYYSF